MGIARGPNLIKDNLVFGYDTGYGVADNTTSTRFYPGEPTTNLFSSPNFTNHTDVTVGTTSIVKQDFGGGKIGIRMIQEGTSDIASFSMGSYSAPTSAGTYTWSSFIHSTSTGGKVKAQVTVYVNGTRHWLTSSNTWTTSVTECNHLFIATVANQWHRIENQFTLPTGTLTNLQLGSFYRSTSNFTIKLANAQFELKSHTTPFTPTTRSDTASLIDLKKTTDIDVSNVSFDSTGQPTFDGTDDRISMGDTSFTDFGTGNFTIEAVLYIPSDITTSTGHYKGVVVKKGASSANAGMGVYYNTGHQKFLWSTADGTSGVERFTTNTFGHLLGTYIHVIMVRDSNTTNNGHFYINGVQEAISSGGSLMDVNNSYNLLVGASSTLYSLYYLEGEIPVAKIYSKALTATEAKQNFNAYKNRFNI